MAMRIEGATHDGYNVGGGGLYPGSNDDRGGGWVLFPARVYSVRMGDGRSATTTGDDKSLFRAYRSGEQAGAGASSRTLATGDGA